MGADLILGILTWDKDEELKWEDGFKAIKNLKEDDEGFVVDDTSYFTKESLNYNLSDIKEAVTKDNRRDVYIMEIGSMKILLTGGMSWGGSDISDLYNALNDIVQADEMIFSAVGFNKPQPDYKSILLKNPTTLPTFMGMDNRLDEIIAEKLKNNNIKGG